MPKFKITLEQQPEVVAKYLAGKSSPELACEYGVVPTAIQYILKKYKIQTRSPKETSTKYSMNVDAFSSLTPESEYWAGFLFADAGLYVEKQKAVLKLGLSSKDAEHIQKFKDFLQTDSPIKTVKFHSSFNKPGEMSSATKLDIFNRKICTDLYNLGLHSERVPNESLMNSRHFWRGAVDGDGCISMRQTLLHHNLCGKPAFLEKYRQFILNNGIQTKVSITAGVGIHYLRFSSHKAANIIKLLYDGAPIFLERKMRLAEEFPAKYSLSVKRLGT